MKTFGLIGRNIDYSFSRKYFSEKFQQENIDAEYRNFDIPDISNFPKLIQENKISGLNVTIPYKQEIIPYLHNLSEEANKIGAVNTIKFEKNATITGHNTDFSGFMEALQPHLEKHHQKALILGTGGASKAIAYALEILEIDFRFVSRKPTQFQFSYDDLNQDIFERYHLIINCTPLGTFPDTQKHPELPFQFLSKEHLIFDLIYNPGETKLMKLASQKGAKTLNGLRMLELQAEKAWKIWNS